MKSARYSIAVALLAAVCSSCSVIPKPNPNQEKILQAGWVNPHPEGSYVAFTSEPSYPKTYNVFKDHTVLAQTTPSNARVKIDLSLQRAILYKGDQIAMDYPIASGRSKYPTPAGSYRIIEKLRDKRSNLYGTILNSGGGVHKSGADSRKDSVPSGGRFRGASMPYWMRLTNTGIGMHQGNVPRYPASHGCVRMPSGVASTVYSKTGVGTPVRIER